MPVKKYRRFEDYFPYHFEADRPEEKVVYAFHLGDISASGNYYLMCAHSTLKIMNVKLLVDTAIAVSTDNYWNVQLANLTQIDNLLATADNTNYDTAIAADSPVTVTPDQNQYLRASDVLELQLTKVASADNLSNLVVQIEALVTGVEATTTSTSTTTTTTTTTSSSTTTTVT